MTDGKILIEANEPCELLYVDYGALGTPARLAPTSMRRAAAL